MSRRSEAAPARIVLAGLHGHGRWHLDEVHRLAERGVARLVGVCDPQPPTPAMNRLVGAAHWGPDLAGVLAVTEPDVTILCTPIHTHVPLALDAAAAGSHVLLEKPPTPSVAEFTRLAGGIEGCGVACQVGFQSLGSGAVECLRAMIADGTLGELRGVGAAGIAVRDDSYFGRAAWVGRRRLDSVDVVDGVLTNPFVHAVATAIRVCGGEAPGAIAGVELELHRANAIEADDTSVARLVTSFGVTITVAATLCAGSEAAPFITVHGTRGRATWWYKRDVVLVEVDDEKRQLQFERVDLLENLVDHARDAGEPLIVPLASTLSVTEFVDTVRRAPEPAPVPPEWRRSVGTDGQRRWVVEGAEAAVRRSAGELTVFSEQDVPWAAPAGGERDVPLIVDGLDVARYELVPDLEQTLAPRPFLHPVRTLDGVVVSERAPEDHRWHLGVGVAIQDVGGVNFWGGRTYVRDRGYEWRGDHGSIRHLTWSSRSTSSFAHDLAWLSPERRCLLVEHRSVTARAAASAHRGWLLEFDFALRNVSGAELRLGSPGSHGRPGGGYGGFFWRLPRTASAVVTTDRCAGEEAVHGTVAPWLAWISHADSAHPAFTIVLAPGDDATAGDPWFVRMASYPGVGSALSWDRPVILAPGEALRRCLRAVVVDGARQDPAEMAQDVLTPSCSIEAS